MSSPPDLHLPNRTGLPPEIAYLRAAYPDAQWRGHANYGELAAFWLHVHDSLRQEGAAVQATVEALRNGDDGAAFQRRFVPLLNQFLQHLDAHHRIEDHAYFPKFRALDPRMAAGFDVLESDHAIIHAQLATSVESARGLLAALNQSGDARRFAVDAHAADSERLLALLIRHLADEEELVIPAMLEHGERSLG